MAIIICPECGGKVSTTLDSCPHCGFKINSNLKNSGTEREFKCVINIKREHRQIGKIVPWYLYYEGNEVATLENSQVYTFIADHPGVYNFVMYHHFNSPTTRPIEKANVLPAEIRLEVLPTDNEINVLVDLNSGMFKSSLVVKNIERH